jgi:hypothetical protein
MAGREAAGTLVGPGDTAASDKPPPPWAPAVAVPAAASG